MRLIIAASLLLASIAHAAGELACYEEPGTRKTTCINEGAVVANGDTRASPVYSGGPNGVRKTPYTFVTNCASGISTLQDSDGVNFAGNFSSATQGFRTRNAYANDLFTLIFHVIHGPSDPPQSRLL